MLCAVVLMALTRVGHAATDNDIVLVRDGVAQSVIVVAPGVMADDKRLEPGAPYTERDAETYRRRLRESVRDLALYLGKMSGAKVEIAATPPADKRVSIYIGQEAVKVFGPPAQKGPYQQGWRVVVGPKGVGLLGESDESSSYAIYELLDRLGCRWYIPSEMGESYPQSKTIAVPVSDISGVPGTTGRFIWYADEDFKRRNRMGGFGIAAGHALEVQRGDNFGYLTRKQLEDHPDWNAMMNGKRSINGRFCWANHEVSDAVADSIIARLDANYQPSISLSPNDGSRFCECPLCKALDTGDYDPVMGTVSITDRYINFCNRVAERVTKKYPNVKLGFLAYAQYTQPPLREKLHPNLVPMLAPINYCRAHTMLDDQCPSREHARQILVGWAKASGEISYYNYMFNLAEYSAPYPMIKQMSDELPLIYANHVKYWQPEGMTDYDAILPGHYLSLRLAWNPQEKPQAVLDEFYSRFYGAAQEPMRRYWTMVDDQWTNVKEHAGCGWGYARRFTPEFMQQARQVMNEALAACQTAMEYRRVKMQDDALKQFEKFMQLRYDLNDGRLNNLGPQSDRWLNTQIYLGDEYAPQAAFDKAHWTPLTAAGRWFNLFYQGTYEDASRVAQTNKFVPGPLRNWKYQQDKEKTGEANGWQNAAFDDKAWKTTDVGTETWYTIGLQDYYGPVWYRTKAKLPANLAGKKVYLWVSSEDGNIKLFVNGQHVPYVNAKGETQDEFVGGYCKPISFDVTDAVKPGAENQVTVIGTHTFINELGTGGLLGPAYFYSPK
jgi:hypothetical protein